MKKALFILLIAAAVGALLWHTRQDPEQHVVTASVLRAPLAETVSEEGKTRLKTRYQISAPLSGSLRRIALQPGDKVQRGQVLAEIEAAPATLLDARSREQAQADIVAAEAALAAAHERVLAAQSTENLAEKERKRLQPLVKNGAAAREQLDRAEAQWQSSRAEHAAARAEENAAAERLTAAQAQLDAGGKSAAAQVFAVRAPIDGQVIRRHLESAQAVSSGQALMEIGDTQDLDIEAKILSAQAVQLQSGMKTRVLRWGGETLEAEIARIEPGGFTKVSALGVEEQRTRVIFSLLSPREQWQNLGDAYRVELDIITRAKDDALQVPLSALIRHGEGWAVYRVNSENRAELVAVQTGLKSAQAAEITESLAEGERVILQPDAQIRGGSKIAK